MGGTAGTSTGGAAGAGAGGAAGAPCGALVAEYAQALAAAKTCNLMPGANACQGSVDSTIEGCAVMQAIDESHQTDIAAMKTAKQQWDSLGCLGSCTGTGGSPATSGKCAQGGQGGDVGVCKNVN